jgi:uncharacterized membrane protein YfhO
VDLALRGTIVPAGSHQITFRYRPGSFTKGVALTLAGLLGATLITIVSRKNSPLAQKMQ